MFLSKYQLVIAYSLFSSFNSIFWFLLPRCSHVDVGEGTWGKNELIESSKKGSHECVWFSDINLSCVINIEFSPGSWEEFGHVSLHLGLWYLLSDKKNFGGSFLGTILIEYFLSSGLSGGIGDGNGVVVEDIVHDIILISTIVSWGWSISSGGWWFAFFTNVEFDCTCRCNKQQDCLEFHFILIILL